MKRKMFRKVAVFLLISLMIPFLNGKRLIIGRSPK